MSGKKKNDFYEKEYLPLNIGTFRYGDNAYELSKKCLCYYGSRGFYCPLLQFHVTGESLHESMELFCVYIDELMKSDDRKVRKAVKRAVKVIKLA